MVFFLSFFSFLFFLFFSLFLKFFDDLKKIQIQKKIENIKKKEKKPLTDIPSSQMID
jgi:hypothetical protein